MNTEFRNKILNRYVESAENEITQEKDAFNDAREKVDALYPKAFEQAIINMFKSIISIILI